MNRKQRRTASAAALAHPSFRNVKDLTYADAKVLCERLRTQVIDAVKKNGGHLSGNLGAVELTVSVLRNFDPERDDLLFDTGHQAYAYKILTGRDVSKIRQKGGVAPFLDREESPCDKASTGHAGSSISLAYGMEKAKEAQGISSSRTVAIVGDGALETGLAYEALDNLGSDESSRLVVVVNDNGMSIQKARGALAKWSAKVRTSLFYGKGAETFYTLFGKRVLTRWFYLLGRRVKNFAKRLLIGQNVFENLGFAYVGPVDGNDVKKVDLAFKRASLHRGGPVVVHLLTQKGKGFPPAEEDLQGAWHGVGPFDECAPEALAKPAKKTYSDYLNELLERKMASDAKVVLIDPAMVFGSKLDAVFGKRPDRCYDVGIAEEHAVAFAGGLALRGAHPVVVIYSTFLQRAYDEIAQEVARQKTAPLFLVERAGLAGGDGGSHHGIYDVAMVKSIPGCRVFMPFEKKGLEGFVESYDFLKGGPAFLRIPKEACLESSVLSFPLTRGLGILRRGSKRLVLAVGPRGLRLVERIVEETAFDGGMLFDLLPSDEALLPLLPYESIDFYDPYGVRSGTADGISRFLSSKGWCGAYRAHALPDAFLPWGDNGEILIDLGLDVGSTFAKIAADSSTGR